MSNSYANKIYKPMVLQLMKVQVLKRRSIALNLQ